MEKKLKSGKKRLLLKCAVIMLMILCVVAPADGWQQQRFELVRQGYRCMEQSQYDAAAAAFDAYLNVDSELYWKLMEWSNDESYSREKVEEALEKCVSLRKK